MEANEVNREHLSLGRNRVWGGIGHQLSQATKNASLEKPVSNAIRQRKSREGKPDKKCETGGHIKK